MNLATTKPKSRYQSVSKQKIEGATYTPKILSDFVAGEILKFAEIEDKKNIFILDPATGDGQLLDSLLEQLPKYPGQLVHVHGYETNLDAFQVAKSLLKDKYPHVNLNFQEVDFLAEVLNYYNDIDQFGLFKKEAPIKYDLIIANPPYVRTQIIGTEKAKVIAKEFGLAGRIDLYHAFIIGITKVLNSKGIAGIIVSNRFMTTKSGSSVRKAILENFNLTRIWDFGDTKLFEAAVLPAVLIANGLKSTSQEEPIFTAIYETTDNPNNYAKHVIDAMSLDGIVKIDDGRIFNIQKGTLDIRNGQTNVWRISTKTNNDWLEIVKNNTWKTFRDLGKIRVGVKTTADPIFIREDWFEITQGNLPELLRPLITHHVARSFKAKSTKENLKILYPHEVKNGLRSSVKIEQYPNTEKYLLQYKLRLASRDYLIDAGRQWYEIWVPQDPEAWSNLKLVFRDISEKPTFWIDESGAVVNGDCYWLILENDNEDLLWLAAAIANSSFIESFYDTSFCNKLYSGRRRFMSQYVEQFPLPNPENSNSKELIDLCKKIYMLIDCRDISYYKEQLNNLVWKTFGLTEKTIRKFEL